MNVFSNELADSENIESISIDSSQNLVNYGDVFFTTSSETPNEVGMSSIWLNTSENTYLNSFCFGYRLNNVSDYDLKFLGYLFRSYNFRKSMTFLAQGISRYNISKNAVLNISIKYPKTDEQCKIGKLFYSINKTITLHQRKYEKLQNIKKGLLDKMFC